MFEPQKQNEVFVMKNKNNSIINYKKHKKSRGKNKNSRRKAGLLKFLFSVAAVVVIVSAVLSASRSVATANETPDGAVLNKYYKTITISPGDTLWSIAEEYRSGAYRSTAEYVKELRSINNLTSDNIVSGRKLVVAYFAE